MKVFGNLETVTTQHLSCEVTAADILDVVRQHTLIPEGARVRIFVEVPGGGDWSNTELDIAEHPVRVRISWSVDPAQKQETDEEQG